MLVGIAADPAGSTGSAVNGVEARMLQGHMLPTNQVPAYLPQVVHQ